ncbi:unnamed protein product [Amoebophrya sp. A120]|nr:unnamed protein product [Amoebophrya sp. A120]|eukprot:GSA120T00013546001.1
MVYFLSLERAGRRTSLRHSLRCSSLALMKTGPVSLPRHGGTVHFSGSLFRTTCVWPIAIPRCYHKFALVPGIKNTWQAVPFFWLFARPLPSPLCRDS